MDDGSGQGLHTGILPILIYVCNINAVMKKMTLALTLLGAMFALSRCAEKKPAAASATTAAVMPANEIAAVKSKYTPAQLEQGKTLYDNNCGKCHEFHEPRENTVHQWDKILPEMCGKAKLTAADAAVLRAWVIVNAKEG